MKRSRVQVFAYLFLIVLSLLGAGFKGIFTQNIFSHKRPMKCPRACQVMALTRTCILEKCTQCKVSHLFAPRDDARNVLIGLIDDEREHIISALYRLTDPDVSKAILRAKDRGVLVEIVVDSGGLDARTSQVAKLRVSGVPIYVFPHPDLELGSKFTIMHNKFFIFYSSGIASSPIVWTGSFNVTKTASRHNRENVLIVQSKQLASDYIEEFARLKKESYRL